jgi:hypothetical protein
MGRPPKPESQRKTRLVQLRLSDAEYRKLRDKAKEKAMTVSEFLRDCGKD